MDTDDLDLNHQKSNPQEENALLPRNTQRSATRRRGIVPNFTAGGYEETPGMISMPSDIPAISPTMGAEKSWSRAAWTENLELNLHSFSKVNSFWTSNYFENLFVFLVAIISESIPYHAI